MSPVPVPLRVLVWIQVGSSSTSVWLSRIWSCVREEIDQLISHGVTEAEVAEAKSYLIGREPFRRETARQWAELLAEAELYGEPVDRPEWCTKRWRQVSRNDVEAAVRRYLRPADIKVTVGIPA